MAEQSALSKRVAEVVEACEVIGSVERSNGAFQHHLAFDLMGRDLDTMTVGDLTRAINAAANRYNRIYDGKSTDDDQEWMDKYLKFGLQDVLTRAQ